MSNNEYEQQQFWEDKSIKWIHFKDSLDNNWSLVFNPLFDKPQIPKFDKTKIKSYYITNGK
jgi:hypothetical protein